MPATAVCSVKQESLLIHTAVATDHDDRLHTYSSKEQVWNYAKIVPLWHPTRSSYFVPTRLCILNSSHPNVSAQLGEVNLYQIQVILGLIIRCTNKSNCSHDNWGEDHKRIDYQQYSDFFKPITDSLTNGVSG